MKRIVLLLVLLCMASSQAWAKEPNKGAILPPRTESKLMTLERQVSLLEQKWFQIDQKIRKMSTRIFAKNKEKAFKRQAKGRSVVTLHFDATQSGVFRVMEVKISIKSKKKTTTLFTTKRSSVTSSINEKNRFYQDVMEPGDYVIKVDSRVQGYSPVFTYLNGYKLRLRNEMGFRVNKRQPVDIRVVFKDTGGMNMQTRLKILFKVRR